MCNRSMMRIVSLLSLLWSLVEVHSQNFPRLSFMGQTLANNSYVDISQVGSGSDNVQCLTDLSTCCTSSEGVHRGDWFFPEGPRLPLSGSQGDLYIERISQGTYIRRANNPTSPTGIYRCSIPTLAVHDDDDISVRDTVYIGLYTASGGAVMLSGGVTFDSDQGTLTCISTGGPATTVTWTRDSTTVTQGTQTVLNDTVTAQYTHTLTVTTAGEYTCTVSNNKPSTASATITLQGPSAPTDVTAVQDGPTSITVTWTPPSPLGYTTGYRISFTGGSDVDIDGGSTNSYTLTGLTNGQTYTISIVAISPIMPTSTPVEVQVTLVPIPEKPTVNMNIIETSPTTITISWSVPTDANESEVSWELTEQTRRRRGVRNAEGGTSGRLPAKQNSYTILRLRSGTSYEVTLTVFNPAGSSFTTFTHSTTEATPCECESADFSTLSIAVFGGVLAVVIVTAIAVQVMVIVIFTRRLQRAKTTAVKSGQHSSVYADSQTTGLELSVSSGKNYVSSNQFQTTSNEAYNYNIVRGTGRTAEASEDSLYEPV